MLTQLNGLLTWWQKQMWDLIPTSLRPDGYFRRRLLIVTAETTDASVVGLSLEGRGGVTSLGRHGLGSSLHTALGRVSKRLRRRTVLEVPAGCLLERQVILPLSAERDVRRVVGYEMDRFTPFRADELMWACTIGRRDVDHKRIYVRVRIVPLTQVQPILDALIQAGLVPDRIRAAGGGQLDGIPILANGPRREWVGPRTLAALWIGCTVLGMIAAALPFLVQSVAQDGVEARIAAMRPYAIEAENLRKVIASGTTTADVIAAARTQEGNPLRSVALLTETLPDDTHLTLLTIHQHKLSISGRSASAARLIGTLAAHPLMRNPTFIAPVVRDEGNNGEMFSIRVEVGP
jgi:general secretion pathway protein L